MSLAAGPWLVPAAAWLTASLGSLLGIVLLNRDFYRLLARVKPFVFLFVALPLHVLYFLCSGIAFGIGLLLHLGRR